MARFMKVGFALAALTVVAVTTAMAGVPDPTQSSVEAVIVGSNRGSFLGGGGVFGTSAVAGFEVIVKDSGGAPLAGVTVTIDFHDALPGQGPGHEDSVVVYTVQTGGVTWTAGSNALAKVTDSNGLALFPPSMGGFVFGNRIPVRANTVLLRSVQARSVDINNDGITNVQDLTAYANAQIFHSNVNTEPQYRYADFNLDNLINVQDQVIYAADQLFGSAKAQAPGH